MGVIILELPHYQALSLVTVWLTETSIYLPQYQPGYARGGDRYCNSSDDIDRVMAFGRYPGNADEYPQYSQEQPELAVIGKYHCRGHHRIQGMIRGEAIIWLVMNDRLDVFDYEGAGIIVNMAGNPCCQEGDGEGENGQLYCPGSNLSF